MVVRAPVSGTRGMSEPAAPHLRGVFDTWPPPNGHWIGFLSLPTHSHARQPGRASSHNPADGQPASICAVPTLPAYAFPAADRPGARRSGPPPHPAPPPVAPTPHDH